MTIYLDLTRQFNEGRLRAILCSGQAVVLHRLALMSKDGDWILREDEEALDHVLRVLERRGARYRYGAPLALPWLRGGWSSHFEFREGPLRVRTDFFTRPPRIGAEMLVSLWREQEGRDPPFVDVRTLVEMKKTNREKDYVVIGELARLLEDPREQLLCSRSARDLLQLAEKYPELARELVGERSVLAAIPAGRDRLEQELDAERRSLIHANERRLETYLAAGAGWARAWPELAREVGDLPLGEAHRRIVEQAGELLPTSPDEASA